MDKKNISKYQNVRKIDVNKSMRMDKSLSDIKLRVYHKCHPAELHTPGTNIIDSSIHLN